MRGVAAERLTYLALSFLFRDRDGRIGAVRHHVDIVRLYDELGIRVRLRFRHDLTKFRIVVRRIEALVSLLLGRIAANVNERVLGADAQLRVALHRNPISNVRDPVPHVNHGGAACETRRERIALLVRIGPRVLAAYSVESSRDRTDPHQTGLGSMARLSRQEDR